MAASGAEQNEVHQNVNLPGSSATNSTVCCIPFIKNTLGFCPSIVGQKVIALNPKTGNYSDFVSLKNIDKNFRPVGIKFNPKGDALYIISNRKFEIKADVPGPPSGLKNYSIGKGLYPFASLHATAWPDADSGIIWKVTKISSSNLTASNTINQNQSQQMQQENQSK